MKKTFILDTNVLLSDANSIFSFGDNDVVLPFMVLEELDRHKDRQDEVGRNAREIARKIAELTKESKDLYKGVSLGDKKGTLRILSIEQAAKRKEVLSLPAELAESDNSGDNTIVKFCLNFQNAQPNETVVFITRDVLLRIKAEALLINVEDYTKFNVVKDPESLYSGVTTITNVDVEDFYSDDDFQLSEEVIKENDLKPNQFVILRNEAVGKSAVARFINEKKPLRELKKPSMGKISPRNKEQEFAVDLLFDNDVKLVTLVGQAGSGKSLLALAAGLEQVIGSHKKYKSLVVCRPMLSVGKEVGFLPGPQPLDAKILTPNGWKTMGEISPESYVISRDGKPTKVLSIYPKGKKEVYKVTTTDGTSTECCLDHLWYTQTKEQKKRGKPGQIRTTQEILNTLKVKTSKGLKPNHYLPRNEPVEYEKKALSLSPYVLGVILGDGSISSYISFSSIDSEIVERMSDELKQYNCEIKKVKNSINYTIKSNLYNNKTAQNVKITNLETNKVEFYDSIGKALEHHKIKRGTMHYRCLNNSIVDNFKYEFIKNNIRWQNPIKNILFNLGLEEKKADSKFIPKDYLYSSIEDRVALLQGLMDTDGTIKTNGEASFCTTSKFLADGIIELVRSLGGRATIRKRNRIGKETILNSKRVITKLPSFEFTISLPEKINPFYLSRKANKWKSSYIHSPKIDSIEKIGEKEVQCILVENPEHLYITDNFIVTHNTIDEKLEPWMAPIKDNLRFILSDGGKKPKAVEETLHLMFENGIIEVQALTFIRGRTIPNAYILIDECFPYSQNILLANGKKVKIGTLVRNFKKEKKTEVMTYNEDTKTFEPKEILAVKSNGVRELVKVTMGNREVWVTDNHKFLTRDNSWQKVSNLKVGDIIMASEHSEHQMMQDLSEDQEQVIYGSFLGDGHVGNHGRNRYRLSVIHSDKQANYCLWKSGMFDEVRIENIKENGYAKKPATRFNTKMFATSVEYPLNKTGLIPSEVLEKIDARGLAIWFMDDGSTNTIGYNHATIWTSSFSYQDNMSLIKMLKERFGINASLSEKTIKDEYFRLNIKSKDFYKLSELISPWVHEELSYKIHPDHRKNINSKNWDVKKTWKKNKVLVVDALDFTNTKKEEVFDIEVKDNHNFIACSTSRKTRGGFIAHNCQNLSGHELKTILTRAGEGSKIVLTGDIEQIDAMYLDSVSNGLTIAIEKFKHHPIAGHVTLTKCERSELASISAKILA